MSVRLKFIGEPAQALARGPFWQPGEERDLTDEEAAPYLTNGNWRAVKTETVDAPTQAVPQPEAVPSPAPQEG